MDFLKEIFLAIKRERGRGDIGEERVGAVIKVSQPIKKTFWFS